MQAFGRLRRQAGFAAAFLLGCVFSGPASAQSLAEVLDIVATRHPRIVSAGYTVRAAEADVTAARSAYRPQVSVGADLGWEGERVATRAGSTFLPDVRVRQLLFDGGRTPAEIQRRRIRVELLGVQEQTILSDLSLELAQAWIDYSRTSELQRVSEEQVAALEKLNALVVEISSFDTGRASDGVLVASRLEQARNILASRSLALAEARSRIGEIAAFPVSPSEPAPDLATRLPASAVERADLAARSPFVRSAELQVDEDAQTVRAERNWWAPQMALEVARTSERTPIGDDRLLNAFEVRLRTSVLPFDSGAGRARKASASARLQASRANADLVRRAVADRVERLWTYQEQRTARLPELEALVGRADGAREIVFEQFRFGRRSILDVLSYDLERFSARAQLVNERHDIVLIRYQLLAALGRVYQAAGGEETSP